MFFAHLLPWYLTGNAASYFKDYNPLLEPTHAAIIAQNWAEWTTVFKHTYFAIGLPTHVTTGWVCMKQLHGETVQEFVNRSTTHLKAFMTYLPSCQQTPLPCMAGSCHWLAPSRLRPVSLAIPT
jgi:hypothetical protein